MLAQYNGAFILLGVILLLVIIYYQTQQYKKIILCQQDYLDRLDQRAIELKEDIRNYKINSATLILAEMKENAYYMVSFLYYFHQRSPEIRVFKETLSNPSIVSDKVWRALSIDAARHFSKNAIQELVKYYTGIIELRLESNRTLEEWADLVRRQLLAYQNSLDILESELGFALSAARGEVFEINGVKLRINRQTGDVQK